MSSKRYAGPIPFDLWGNQLHYPEPTYPRYLSAEDWDGTDVWGWHGYGAQKREPIRTFTHEEMGLVIYPTPQTQQGWNSDKPMVGQHDQIVWKPNAPFEDTLVYDGYRRGRSAAYLCFVSKTTARAFTVFMDDFDTGFAREMVRGEVVGTFAFCKRGQNYGTVRV
jgi:hypothetical protein